jgi:uncharacterized membrane protein YfcA
MLINEILFELIFIGIITGTISGFFGIGGGIVLIPMLMFIGLDIKEAVAISIVQMIFSSVYGSYLNIKSKTLDIKDGLYIGIGGFTGALFSGYIVSTVPSDLLEILFFLFVGFAIYKLATHKSINQIKKIDVSKILLFVIGFFIGSTAISIGVGGSTLLTPILVGYLFYNTKEATSMGLFFVVFSSISGFISMLYFGTLNLAGGIIVGISSLFGVFIGIKLKNMINNNNYKKYILYLYIIIFVCTFYKVFILK